MLTCAEVFRKYLWTLNCKFKDAKSTRLENLQNSYKLHENYVNGIQYLVDQCYLFHQTAR